MWFLRLLCGLAAGGAIAYVDNVAFGGEVSPIVVVVMLLAATAVAAAIWGRSGWTAAAVTWVCTPLVHLVRHVLGMPDPLQPNTYGSILMLSAFTLVIAAFGVGVGMLVHWTAVPAARHQPRTH